jgi:hypothetical protein
MSIVDKAKAAVTKDPSKTDRAVGKGGDAFDAKTGGKHAGAVDKAQAKVSQAIHKP